MYQSRTLRAKRNLARRPFINLLSGKWFSGFGVLVIAVLLLAGIFGWTTTKTRAATGVSVDFTTPIQTISPLAYGIDISGYGRGVYITNNQANADRLQALGVGQARMHLKWATPGDPDSALQCGGGSCAVAESGDAWVSAIKSIGAEPVVLVDASGLHTPEADITDAVNMVKHFNIESGNPVKRWIIGNEPDHTGNANRMDAAAYSERFNAMYDAMKAVDPSIKIGGPATAFFNKPFIETFLTNCGSRVDFVDFHKYGQGGQVERSNAELLSTVPNDFENHLLTLKQMIAAKAPQRAAQIEMVVGEWQMDWDDDIKSNTHFYTLWSSTVLGRMLRAGGYAMLYADKGVLGALVGNANEPAGSAVNDPRPIYHGISMYTGGGLFRKFGTTMVSSTSTVPDVEVFASSSEKNIVAINKNKGTAQNVAFTLNGVVSGQMDVWRKDPSMPPMAPPVKVGTAPIANATFTYDLPAGSVTTFVITQESNVWPGTGLAATYYNNSNFTGTSVSRTDPVVDFGWTGVPAPGIAADTFSVRWRGFIVPTQTETYRFYTHSDDGVRLWMNGTLLVNNWTNHSTTENSGTIPLTAGKRYPVTLEFYDNTYSATMRMFWSSPSTPKAIVPAAQLFLQ
jgi:hypothetical protein